MATTIRLSAPAKLWRSYLSALETRPIRTKILTSTGLFMTGDVFAQLAIEQRTLGIEERIKDAGVPKDTRHLYDPARTLRMGSYGVIFAPLGHMWLQTMSRISFPSTLKTVSVRMVFDSFLWSPFVCCLFPTCIGTMEGKSMKQIKQKIDTFAFTTWVRAQCVFGPTQLMNYTFVPLHLRLLVLQTAGFCWNIYLSWANESSNRYFEDGLHSPID